MCVGDKVNVCSVDDQILTIQTLIINFIKGPDSLIIKFLPIDTLIIKVLSINTLVTTIQVHLSREKKETN